MNNPFLEYQHSLDSYSTLYLQLHVYMYIMQQQVLHMYMYRYFLLDIYFRPIRRVIRNLHWPKIFGHWYPSAKVKA